MAFSDTKPHYALLDGLRGVAALLVVWYHVFEGFSFAGGTLIEHINHGYLAVDFFFILSGFVISYAYDDRWQKGFTLRNFFSRRLIRLHPMVILGALIGAITFLLQGSVQWDGTPIVTSWVMIALLMAMFFIPAYPGFPYEVRGNGEMFPLNGPAWSLFFEYIGNILYALFIRRLTNKALILLVCLLGAGLSYYALFDVSTYGMIGVGWTLDRVNFIGGLLRMGFPFTLGMLLARHFQPRPVRGAFWICSIVLVGLFTVPYIEGMNPVCLNGVFELLCIFVIFPLLVWIAASSTTTDRRSAQVCQFLGNLSYPLYMIHYPFMYLFFAWLIKRQLYSFGETWLIALAVYVWNVWIAYLCMRFYDKPLRHWLIDNYLKVKRAK